MASVSDPDTTFHLYLVLVSSSWGKIMCILIGKEREESFNILWRIRTFYLENAAPDMQKIIKMSKSELKFCFSFDTVCADFVVTNVLGDEWEST
jgi:hypothetical protein